MSEKQIDFKSLVSFVRTNGLKILVRAGLSLFAALVLLALYVAFAPRSERYAVEIQVTLESRNGVLYYPNGDRFGAHDIISAPVLNLIWKKYGFDKKGVKGVKFEDFCQWFGIVNYDKERAKVDAEFQGKMAKRNITVTELATVQKEYEERVASLSANRFMLSMCPEAAVDHETAAKMMNDIPEVWFTEYARLKAPIMPPVSAADAVRSYLTRVKNDNLRSIELIDTLNDYWRELQGTCRYIRHSLMKGRNAQMEGIDLGVYESQMQILRADILRVKNRILSSGPSADFGVFVAARQEDIECERIALEERIAAVQQSIDVLGDGCRQGGRQSAAKKGAASDGSPVTVQADAGFFADFAEMVRRSSNQEQIGRYVDELTSFRKEMAAIKARELYYEQIKHHMEKNRVHAGATAEFSEAKADLDLLINNILTLGERIVAFRDRCFSIYRTSDQFYVIAASAAYGKSFVLSLPRFLIGLLAVWALVNLALLARDWRV